MTHPVKPEAVLVLVQCLFTTVIFFLPFLLSLPTLVNYLKVHRHLTSGTCIGESVQLNPLSPDADK